MSYINIEKGLLYHRLNSTQPYYYILKIDSIFVYGVSQFILGSMVYVHLFGQNMYKKIYYVNQKVTKKFTAKKKKPQESISVNNDTTCIYDHFVLFNLNSSVMFSVTTVMLVG